MRLVLDFDGTVTERDTLDIVLERFGDAEVYERAEAELDAGRMTLNEVISAEFATVTAPLDEVVAYVVEHARVRPGFAELARARHPLVVSSGFHELIEPVLEREGVLDAVELRANRVDARPDGWQRALPRGRDLRGLRRAVQARATCPPARSSTPATATPTTARRSPPTGSSPRAASRAGSTSAASPFEPLTDFRALA